MTMDKRAFCQSYVARFPGQAALYEEHLRAFGEIRLHLFASAALNREMAKAQAAGKWELFARYCAFIEEAWRGADEEVRNALDVTVLEELSDHRALWEAFGRLIGADFKHYINDVLLRENIMMREVEPLR